VGPLTRGPESGTALRRDKIDFKVNPEQDDGMDAPFLPAALRALEHAAARMGLNRRDWAARAGVRPESLSRLFGRDDCDLRTLTNLALAAGQRLLFAAQPDRKMPSVWNREVERKYALLCASGSTDVARWLREGPAYFLSGVAMMVASARGFDREAYLRLAFALCPAMQDVGEFDSWLSNSPAKPSRFLPMVRALRPLAR
jgi:hypothetical protein